jgi:hypothetical protein
MVMGYTWRHNGDGTTDAVETDELVEVVYEDNETLVVHLARSLASDDRLEAALVDAVARQDQRSSAEREIASVADNFGLDIHEDGDAARRAVTIAPRAAFRRQA